MSKENEGKKGIGAEPGGEEKKEGNQKEKKKLVVWSILDTGKCKERKKRIGKEREIVRKERKRKTNAKGKETKKERKLF